MRKNWILTGIAALILSIALIGCPIEEEKEKLPPIEKVWIIGSYAGWAPSATENPDFELTKNADGTFTWSGELNEWMKFVGNSVPNSDTKGIWIGPTGANEDVDLEELDSSVTLNFGIFYNGAQGKGAYHIVNNGTYDITVNVKTMKVTFKLKSEVITYVPENAIWLVGPSTATDDGYDGWKMPSAGNPNKMTTSNYITYIWTGNLKQSPNYGEGQDPGVAFITDFDGKNPNWGDSIWFVANDATDADSGKTCQAVTPGTEYPAVKKLTGGNNNYNMFNITQAGNYTITLNVNTKKVIFEKN